MPFTKVGKNKYKSPSGRTFTTAQVKLYYATDGFKKKPRKGGGKRMKKKSGKSASKPMKKGGKAKKGKKKSSY